MTWAARERQAGEWARTATIVRWLVAAFSGKTVLVEEIIPAGILESDSVRPTPEQEEAAAKLTWDRLFAAVQSGCVR